jgi:hypothetical protein
MDTPNTGEGIGAVMAIIVMVVFQGGFMLFMLGSVVVWIVALVDVVKREFKEPNDKLIWVLVVCLTQFIGALIYLAVGRQKGWLPGERPGPPQ